MDLFIIHKPLKSQGYVNLWDTKRLSKGQTGMDSFKEINS